MVSIRKGTFYVTGCEIMIGWFMDFRYSISVFCVESVTVGRKWRMEENRQLN